jgi:hypothetical protein
MEKVNSDLFFLDEYHQVSEMPSFVFSHPTKPLGPAPASR